MDIQLEKGRLCREPRLDKMGMVYQKPRVQFSSRAAHLITGRQSIMSLDNTGTAITRRRHAALQRPEARSVRRDLWI
jgi:hypothetical protein